jgi:hypothetical protein
MAEKPPDDRDPRPADAGDTAPLSSPYGPQPKGVDEAAGGADSSPLETEPTGEQREQTAARETAMGRPPASGPAHGDDRSP